VAPAQSWKRWLAHFGPCPRARESAASPTARFLVWNRFLRCLEAHDEPTFNSAIEPAGRFRKDRHELNQRFFTCRRSKARQLLPAAERLVQAGLCGPQGRRTRRNSAEPFGGPPGWAEAGLATVPLNVCRWARFYSSIVWRTAVTPVNATQWRPLNRPSWRRQGQVAGDAQSCLAYFEGRRVLAGSRPIAAEWYSAPPIWAIPRVPSDMVQPGCIWSAFGRAPRIRQVSESGLPRGHSERPERWRGSATSIIMPGV